MGSLYNFNTRTSRFNYLIHRYLIFNVEFSALNLLYICFVSNFHACNQLNKVWLTTWSSWTTHVYIYLLTSECRVGAELWSLRSCALVTNCTLEPERRWHGDIRWVTCSNISTKSDDSCLQIKVTTRYTLTCFILLSTDTSRMDYNVF